ncbi:MAG: hypothetical protein MJ072_01510, partial [Clostridia bacterium]|nr:hypothetical protein [Clostridia bacterium]
GCKGKNACLMTANDIAGSTDGVKLSEEEISKIVDDLGYDGYLGVIYSDRKGEKVFCLSLTAKGLRYERERKNAKKSLLIKLMTTVCFALLSFIIGIILRSVFK